MRYQDYAYIKKKVFCETRFIDHELLSLAIEFYNYYFGYKDNPITEVDVMKYAELGVRLNADLFKSMLPMTLETLNYFYKITPFYFFHDILRFMDGFHIEEGYEMMDRFKPPVLDFAGGTGGHTIFMAKRGWDVAYHDSNNIQLTWMKWLKEKTGLNYRIFENVSDIKEKFNLVVAKDIIEHVVDPIKFVELLKSFLTKEGQMILTQMPCCGPDEMAPMHFKVDFAGEVITSSVEDNLASLNRCR